MTLAQQIANALRAQESGGSSDPDILNSSSGSGARGPWQIMPANWPQWAQLAGLPADAPWTLANQEKVVAHQIQQHLDAGRSPEDIAAIWYSGQPLGANQDAPQVGGPSIRDYVNGVISKMGSGGRAETGATTMPAPAQQTATTPTRSVFGIKLPVEGIRTGIVKGASLPKVGGTYKPTVRTGNTQSDLKTYMADLFSENDKFSEYTAGLDYVVEPDADTGVVYKIDPLSGEKIPDISATKAYAGYHNAATNFDLLQKAIKAGITANGDSAAAAYLKSETDKQLSHMKDYEQFHNQIGDLVTLDNVPLDRAQSLAATLASITVNNKNRTLATDPKGYLNPHVESTDFGPLAAKLREQVNAGPPSPYSINPAALAPAPSASTSVPMPKPEQVLAKYGLGGINTEQAGYNDAGIAPPDTATTPTISGTPPVSTPPSSPSGPSSIWGSGIDDKVWDGTKWIAKNANVAGLVKKLLGN